MAFIAMVFAAMYIVIIIVGLFILTIGIVLDIIWGVRKKKQKKVHAVLKVFAVILTVLGIIVGIGPIALVAGMSLDAKLEHKAEVSDLAPEDCIEIEDIGEVSENNGFDFRGKHYRRAEELHAITTQDRFSSHKVGAFIQPNDAHYLIYEVDSLADSSILYGDRMTGVFVESDKYDETIDYYLNEAPFYASVSRNDDDAYFDVDGIDSERARKIVELVKDKGSRYGEYLNGGYIIFYTLDDLYYIDLHFEQKEEGLEVSSGNYQMILDDDDAEFILSIVNGD